MIREVASSWTAQKSDRIFRLGNVRLCWLIKTPPIALLLFKVNVSIQQTPFPPLSRRPYCAYLLLKNKRTVWLFCPLFSFPQYGCFQNIGGFPPKSSILIRVFHYKPSILGGFPPIFGNTHMFFLGGPILTLPFPSLLRETHPRCHTTCRQNPPRFLGELEHLSPETTTKDTQTTRCFFNLECVERNGC